MTEHGSGRSFDSTPPEAFDRILDAAQAGAEWAWSRLVEEMSPILGSYIRRLGAQDPDDLLGETWLHVARGAHRFRGDFSNFRSWVFTIAHHRVIDERRKKERKPTQLEDDTELDRLGPASVSAESDVMETLDMEDVDQVLRCLTPQQREVVLLRVIGGFGIKEIGDIVGRRPGAVQALQHRAFKNLERNLRRTVRLGLSPSVTEVR